MRKFVFAFLALGACSGTVDPMGGPDARAGGGPDGAAGGADGPGGSSGDAAMLHGVPPAMATPAPEFMATNRDNMARNRTHLTTRGPTVMWFYPAATTYG